MRFLAVLTVVGLLLAVTVPAGAVTLSIDVQAGSAANGWNTSPVNLTRPNVLDWYIANNADAVNGYSVGANWWNWVYTAPGNQKAGATVLSNYQLLYSDANGGYTGGHDIDTANTVLFTYTDGTSPVSDTDVKARTNWMSDKTADGSLSMRVAVDAAEWMRVTHWFNYSHELENFAKGHTLSAKLYDASNILLQTISWTDTGPLDWGFIRTYTASIDIKGAAAGDYLIVENLTSNIGYRGTMVEAVPEPLTMLGLLLGVGGVAGYLRRRRKA